MALRPGLSLMDWNRLAATVKPPSSDQRRSEITYQQLRQHSREKSCWMLVRGVVYDVTKYLPYHPGGVEEVLRAGGDDGTALFQEYHAWVSIESMLKNFVVGTIVPLEEDDPTGQWHDAVVTRRAAAADHTATVSLQWVSTSESAKQMKRTRGLWHVVIRAEILNAARKPRVVERPMTPLPGFFADSDDLTLLVRHYHPTRRAFSWRLTHESDAKVVRDEDDDDIAHPVKGIRVLKIRKALSDPIEGEAWRQCDSLILICAGSGITPALQIINECLISQGLLTREDEAEAPVESLRVPSNLTLVWTNTRLSAVPLLSRLQAAANLLKGSLRVTHLLSRPEETDEVNFQQSFESSPYVMLKTGRFEAEHVEDLGFPPHFDGDVSKTRALVCGPWDFERSVRGTLFMAGYRADQIMKVW